MNPSREFDIINNKYRNDNENKQLIEKKVQKLQAARKYWEKNDYDVIKAKFLNENKEKEFNDKRLIKQENWAKIATERNLRNIRGYL